MNFPKNFFLGEGDQRQIQSVIGVGEWTSQKFFFGVRGLIVYDLERYLRRGKNDFIN